LGGRCSRIGRLRCRTGLVGGVDDVGASACVAGGSGADGADSAVVNTSCERFSCPRSSTRSTARAAPNAGTDGYPFQHPHVGREVLDRVAIHGVGPRPGAASLEHRPRCPSGAHSRYGSRESGSGLRAITNCAPTPESASPLCHRPMPRRLGRCRSPCGRLAPVWISCAQHDGRGDATAVVTVVSKDALLWAHDAGRP
jgi:hypothetical protein